MNSHHKVAIAIAKLDEILEADDTPSGLRLAAGALTFARPHLIRMLPTTSEELDQLLDRGADWLRGLRSDIESTAEEIHAGYSTDETGEHTEQTW